MHKPDIQEQDMATVSAGLDMLRLPKARESELFLSLVSLLSLTILSCA